MDTIKSLKPNIVTVLNIIKLDAIDSSNNYLKLLVSETIVNDETVVVVNDQQKGRGQMGNGWVSKRDQSLTFSVYKRFEGLLAENQFIISMAVSLAIAECFEALGVPKVSIKWPNDIMSANKKLAGILIENVVEGYQIKYSIIGIGINVNEDAFPNLPRASSLKLSTGLQFNLDEVLQLVIEKILLGLKLTQSRSFSEMRSLYEIQLFHKDIVSVFENLNGHLFNGIVRGISDIGELIIETENDPGAKVQLKELKMIF